MSIELPKMIIYDVDETLAVCHVGRKIIEAFAKKYGFSVSDEAWAKYEKEAFRERKPFGKIPYRDDLIGASKNWHFKIA